MRRLRNCVAWTLLPTLLILSGAAFSQEAPPSQPPQAGVAQAPSAAKVNSAEGGGATQPPLAAAPAPPAAPAPTAPPPAAQPTEPAGQPAPPAAQGIILNFKDASLDAVLNYLSESAGLIVLKETPIEGRVTIVGLQPLTVDDAIALLNSILKDKGCAAVRIGRILKVVALDDAKKRSIPVRAGSDPAMIELSDEVITQVIPLRFIDAVKLKQDIVSLIPATASLASNAAGNALILTDTSANVRRIAEIVRALDTHMAGVAEVKVFQLKYANATNVAKLVTDVFKEDQATTQRTGFAFGGGRFMGVQTPGQPTSDDQARRPPRVSATADDRTNTVVVTGPPDTLKVAERIIKELDANPIDEQSVFIYPMKNGQAKTLETVLNNLFGTTQQGRAGTTGGTTGGQRTAQMTAFGQGQGVTTAAAQAAAGLYGQVYVVANADTNSLMVMTSPRNFDRVKAILAELDRAVPQVLIKVLLVEVTHDDTVDLGAEFSFLNLRASGLGQKYFSDLGVGALATQGAATPGGLVAKVMEGDFIATLRALETVGKVDVLSRPYILASDNQAASIQVGSSFPFITNTLYTDTGQTRNTIQYQDIGIILKVTPHINPEGLVIMDVNPQITATTDSTVPISETVNAVVFTKRNAQTRVGIRDGQTIVIGGLMQDRKTETIQKVPLLGSIPLIGSLFQRHITGKSKTELLIFLTPQVAAQPDDLQAMSEQDQQRSKLAPGAVTPGTFEEHMKGMRKE